MAFVAQCLFCRLMVQGVPDQYLGNSVECPRCHNSFTLAAMRDPPPAATRVVNVPRAAPFAPPPLQPPHAPAGSRPVTPMGSTPTVAGEATVPRTPLMAEIPAQRLAIELRTDPSLPNYPAVVSFLSGACAFLAAALVHAGWLTLVLGLLGLILGVVGFVRGSASGRVLLSGTGILVSLAAAIAALALPEWLGLDPLWSRPRGPQRTPDIAISLSGEGGQRPVTAGEPVWVDASRDALIHGGIRLRVSSATVGSVAFEPVQGKQPPRDRSLVLGLRVTNSGIAGKVNYRGWATNSLSQERPVLRDDQGRTYPEKTFDFAWVIKGRASAAAIPPGKTLDDVLIFEAPPTTITYLRLELPGQSLGGEGQLRMEIPRSMIAFH